MKYVDIRDLIKIVCKIKQGTELQYFYRCGSTKEI